MARRKKSSINLVTLLVAVVVLLVARFVSFVGDAVSSIFTPDQPVSRAAYSASSNVNPTYTVNSTIKPTQKPVPTSTPSYSSLRRGDSGADVEKLQIRLGALGFLTGNIDGSYGAKTESAVKSFQKAAGLTQDGVAGAKTQAALFASSAPTAPPSSSKASVNSGKTSDSAGNTEETTYNYIGNRNSKKFHHSWCSSVSDMKSSNQVPFSNRSEAINSGYKPCGRCNP